MPRIGVISGATIIAPITVAVESHPRSVPPEPDLVTHVLDIENVGDRIDR